MTCPPIIEYGVIRCFFYNDTKKYSTKRADGFDLWTKVALMSNLRILSLVSSRYVHHANQVSWNPPKSAVSPRLLWLTLSMHETYNPDFATQVTADETYFVRYSDQGPDSRS